MKRSCLFRTPPQLIKSKWEGNVTHAEEKGNAFSVLMGNMKGRDHLKDLNTNASTLRCGKIRFMYIHIYNKCNIYVVFIICGNLRSLNLPCFWVPF